jgi:hypothetical protein
MIASTPKFRVDATGPEMIPVARKLEDWYDWLCQETTTKFRTKVRAGVKSSAIYGVGIFKTYYRLDIRAAYRSKPAEIQMTMHADGFVQSGPVTSAGRGLEVEPLVAANNPDFDNVSVFDLYLTRGDQHPGCRVRHPSIDRAVAGDPLDGRQQGVRRERPRRARPQLARPDHPGRPVRQVPPEPGAG